MKKAGCRTHESECIVTHMTSTLSTAEQRRPAVVASALRSFAAGGYGGTTVADVAADAKISPAYVFKLFPSKERLFVAALDQCYEQIEAALGAGADAAVGAKPADILDAMGGAYAELIADRTLLLIQVHAQSASAVAEIGAAQRRGTEKITRFAKTRSGASDSEVQRFIAFGQLCHLIVTTGLDGSTDPWARILTAGIRHP